MDIEKLTKSQIILLTLLVSFVTSIATGIVTVSLMDQAPPAIAQTVSRVIERTIQTVASTTPKGQAAATIITQEKTVVVKESELISSAVAKVNPSIVRLYSSDAQNPTFLGLGIVLDASGAIIADVGEFGEAPDAVVQLQDGSRVRAFITARDTDLGVAHLLAATTTLSGGPITWSPIAISPDQPSLGETIVTIAGKSEPQIAEGIVTSINSNGTPPIIVNTDINSDIILPGAALIHTDGSVVGVSTAVSRASSLSGFISAGALMKAAPPKK
jgi:hypothetical protein